MLAPEARFRRFARAVTTEVGALEDSFLGLGRSLGAARVLNAIGRGTTDIATLRSYLKLDSGLLSRLLRGLESERLVVTSPDPADGRRRVAMLTPAGRREFRRYEKLSDFRAKTLLDSHPRAGALLDALDLIATALSVEQVEVRQVDPDSDAARFCLSKYYEELDARFEDGFQVGLSRDPGLSRMRPPKGAFVVAMSDGLAIGCGALSGDGTDIAEVKRVWVAACARGFGIAGRLMSSIEATARAMHVRELRLDTNRSLPEAVAFYRKAGWREIGRFNDDPYADYFFAKTLA